MSTSTPYWDSAGLNLSNTNSFRAGSFGANNYITVGTPSGYTSSVTTGGGLDVSGMLNSSTGVFLTPGSGASLTLTSALFGYNTGYWPTVGNSGLQIGWNSIVSGTGTTDFLNNGKDGSGGFIFATTNSSSTGITPLMTMKTGAVGIGTTTPSYPLHVIGNIGLTGAITPLYTSPSFTSSQIGYIYTAFNASGVTAITATDSILTQSIQNIPIGIWLATVNISVSPTSTGVQSYTGYYQTYIYNNTVNVIGTLFFGSVAGNYATSSYCFVIKNTSATNSYFLRGATGGAYNVNLYGLYFQMVRIA